MVTYNTKINDGFWRDGKFVECVECYITETSDISKIPANAPGSTAINIVNQDIWVLRSDFKWQKFGSEEVYV